MNSEVLRTELQSDPLGRGYSGMSNAGVVIDLKTEHRSRPRPSMSGDEIFAATDPSEFAALSDAKRQLWLAFCGRESLNPFGAANVSFVEWIFGSPSAVRTELLALRVEPISRETELGLGNVREGDVERIRNPKPK